MEYIYIYISMHYIVTIMHNKEMQGWYDWKAFNLFFKEWDNHSLSWAGLPDECRERSNIVYNLQANATHVLQFLQLCFPKFSTQSHRAHKSKSSFAAQHAKALSFDANSLCHVGRHRLGNMINECVSQIQPIVIFRSCSNQLEMLIMNHRYPAWFDSTCLLIDIGHTSYQQMHSSRI